MLYHFPKGGHKILKGGRMPPLKKTLNDQSTRPYCSHIIKNQPYRRLLVLILAPVVDLRPTDFSGREQLLLHNSSATMRGLRASAPLLDTDYYSTASSSHALSCKPHLGAISWDTNCYVRESLLAKT